MLLLLAVLSVTVKVRLLVPLLPSATELLAIEMVGGAISLKAKIAVTPASVPAELI